MKFLTKISLLLIGLFATQARADLIFSGDFTTGSGQIEITADIEFDIIVNSTDFFGFAFDDIVTSDGSISFQLISPDLAYESSIGGAQVEAVNFADNELAFGDVTVSDGLLIFDQVTPNVVNGETVTLNAGTYSVGADPNFNPAYNSLTFTGNAFVIDGSGVRLSEFESVSSVSAVPEPTSVLLLGVCAAGFVAKRRRRFLVSQKSEIDTSASLNDACV